MPFTTFLARIQGKVVEEAPIVVEETPAVIEMPVFEDVAEEILEEEFPEADVEEVAETKEILSEEELQALSKTELDEYAFGYGIELDRRKSKSSMINDFITQINKGE